MASVVVAPARQPAPPLPAVCVKTGVPTTKFVAIHGTAARVGSGAMIVFGFVPWLAAAFLTSEPFDLRVPVHPAALARYRQWRQASLAVVAIGLVVGFFAAAANWGDPLILLGLAVTGMVAYLVNEWVNWFGVCLTRDGALMLTRVHPAFLEASRVNDPV
jgi:hypothetical protein